MKKSYFALVLLVIIILLGGVFFLAKINGGVSNNQKIETIKGGVKGSDINNSGSASIPGPTNQKKSGLELQTECEKIISGKRSEYLESEKLDLLNIYSGALSNINNKSYLNFLNLKKGNCDFFKGSEKETCIYFKANDRESILNTYKNDTFNSVLFDSLLSSTNKCNQLTEKNDLKDCTDIYNSYNVLFDDVDSKADILALGSMEHGKIISVKGKDFYLETLNKQFLAECEK
nr:hypothetical protein [Candidatus Gracilibacteria bacterium]